MSSKALRYPPAPSSSVFCQRCDGCGHSISQDPSTVIPCEECSKSGLDPIPWSELFVVGRPWFMETEK